MPTIAIESRLAAPLAFFALLLAAGAARADTPRASMVPRLVLPHSVEITSWADKGGDFRDEWRADVTPDLPLERLARLMPPPNFMETVNEDVWAVWDYVRFEGEVRWSSAGTGPTPDVEQRRCLRVLLADDLAVRWEYEEWSGDRRVQETSEWFFSPEQVIRRTRAIAEAEAGLEEAAARAREVNDKNTRVKVDFDAEFD